MNIKRLMAGGLAALAAGSTLAFGIYAASSSLGDFVVAKDNSLTSPIIVVGDTAAAKDIVSAADIAAAVAGYATTPVTTSGSVATSVSGGVAVDTVNTKFYLGDSPKKSGLKQTITSVDLSTLLKSGIVTDGSGTKYNYDQYVKMATAGTNNQTVATFGTSGGDLSDPALYLDIGIQANSPSATSDPMYNLTVNFNKLLNLSKTSSDAASVQGQEIVLFGNTYTIGSGSNASNKLILFGTSNSQLLSEGAAAATVVVNGASHTVKLEGVSSTTAAVVSVDGVSKEVTEGNTYTINGVDVYADQIYYYSKEAQQSQAKISFGSKKITFTNGSSVTTGQSDDVVDGTRVEFSGSGWSGISTMSVAVTAKDSTHDYIKAGDCMTDPVFKTVKVCFNGLNGGGTDTIVVDNSGTTAASVKFMDYRGKEKTFNWAYTGTSAFTPALNSTSTQKYIVFENESGRVNDYWVLAPERASVDVSDFGHVLQLTSVSTFGSSGAYVELKDVFSGETNRVYLDASAYDSATFYLDGNAYYIHGYSSGTWWNVAWGAGASANVVGSKTTVWPLIPTQRGGWVSLVTNATLTNGTTYELPTNISFVYNYTRDGSESGQVGGTGGGTFGQIRYNITSNITTLQKASGARALTDGNPQLLVLEEKGKNRAWPSGGSDTDTQDAVIVAIADGSGSGVDLTVQTPTLTSPTQYSGTLQSDNSVTEYYDRYGTKVAFDSDGQGLVTVTYPDNQANAQVAVGSDPKFGAASTGTTVETAVKIKNPVSKLASEVTTTALGGDLILIGGPCANTLVAQLWAPTVTCENWDSTTRGQILEVANAFSSGKKALIVAGTTADDTRWLASQVMQGVLSWPL